MNESKVVSISDCKGIANTNNVSRRLFKGKSNESNDDDSWVEFRSKSLNKEVEVLSQDNYFELTENKHDSVEMEEIDLSDSDENSLNIAECSVEVNIDPNSRITTHCAYQNGHEKKDDCTTEYREGHIDFSLKCHKVNEAPETSSEELEMSDDEQAISRKYLNTESVNLHSFMTVAACRTFADAKGKDANTDNSAEYTTDSEFISDEDIGKAGESNLKKYFRSGKNFMASGNVAKKIQLGVYSVIHGIAAPKVCLNSSDNLDKYLLKSDEEEDDEVFVSDNISLSKSLRNNQLKLLCLDPSEIAGATDTEDIYVDSDEEQKLPPHKDSLKEDTLGIAQRIDSKRKHKQSIHFLQKSALDFALKDQNGKRNTQFMEDPVSGKNNSSEIVDYFTDYETLSDQGEYFLPQTRIKKENYFGKQQNVVLFSENDSNSDLTDEELIDEVGSFKNVQFKEKNMDDREWTETDDLGGVRQVTQIKTETSIKVLGDDEDVTSDDDLVSRTTTTTTTRIVTTVTTDDGEEAGEPQAPEGGEELRHSMEAILDQFMSGEDASSQDPNIQRSQPQ